ncbi:ubiE/COQ5 methyltransferase family protein [Lyngbya aestuarii BL J]|uniref:UbiE/COQ5 methyltransferase family protein n=1 Tax=Lyngbya aestuarii BL J TaxID=1348334 RepID=U7QLV8_9CYAN|nr:class I SAM-dependent methyltransferase [Lyngbya aestuarii]ERT08095.1 ubiE/COQ5 methyltransferase family protein [Lyngbya aestuarii BL J]
MNAQFKHAILPQTTHDELARQNFVQSLSLYVNRKMGSGIKTVYEKNVKPNFEEKHQRVPENRHEILQEMQTQSYYHWWSILKRFQQEMMWESVGSSVERQLPDLIKKAKNIQNQIGSLILDPNFQTPAYMSEVDIHCMPGGYHTEIIENDLAAGAVYDRGVYVYGLGWLGTLNDNMGHSIIQNYLQPNYPHFQPKKILDMGCAVGHSTLPYVDAYPDAEIHGIDIGSPMLHYGHARAEALKKRVQFSQQNAEKTSFIDGTFDLIVSHILLHEIPASAIENVMRESYRLLAPGGIMIHLDAPLYRHMDAYTAFISDWQTINNNEPFWGEMRELDLTAIVKKAGFNSEKVSENFIRKYSCKTPQNYSYQKTPPVSNRPTWFVITAQK